MNISAGGQVIIRLCIAFAVLDSIAVLLRLLAKRFTKVKFAADDAWIISAICCFYVFVGTIIWGQKSVSIDVLS